MNDRERWKTIILLLLYCNIKLLRFIKPLGSGMPIFVHL